MDATQLYETVIVNRDLDSGETRGPSAVQIMTIPARSLANGEVPPANVLANDLGAGFELRTDWSGFDPSQTWGLPFLLDAVLGNYPEFPWVLEVPTPGRGARRQGETPTQFAQHLAFAPIVPFENSPLAPKSLAEILVAAGTSAGGAVGVLNTGEPLVVLAVPAGIIIIGAARGISDGLRIGLRSKVLKWMGVDDPNQKD